MTTAAVHGAAFPPCSLCVGGRWLSTLQWEARLFSQVGQRVPKGLHLCKTPIRDIKLNCLSDFFLLPVYLTSYRSFTFPDFVFLPNYPLFPPRTTASGIGPARTGRNTWNMHTGLPVRKTILRNSKDLRIIMDYINFFVFIYDISL